MSSDTYGRPPGLSDEEWEAVQRLRRQREPVVECWYCGHMNERGRVLCTECSTALPDSDDPEPEMTPEQRYRDKEYRHLAGHIAAAVDHAAREREADFWDNFTRPRRPPVWMIWFCLIVIVIMAVGIFIGMNPPH